MAPKRAAGEGVETVKKKAKGVVALLQGLYGDLADRNDGQTKDDSKRGARTLMTTLAKIKGVSQDIREATVTLPLEQCIAEHCPKNFVDEVRLRSAFVTRLRVNASRLANFIFYEGLESTEQGLPEINDKFFTDCLTICRNKKGALHAEFERFSQATGIERLAPPSGITQICVWQGKEMFTAAKNMVNLNYEKRRISILRWSVKKLIYHSNRPVENSTAMNERINRVVKLITRSTPNSLPDMNRSDVAEDTGEMTREGLTSLETLLQELNLQDFADSIIDIYRREVDALPTCNTLHGCLRHLHNLQVQHVHADRRAYEQIQQQASQDRPPVISDKDWGQLIGKRIKERWKGGPPPGEKTPLPMCKTQGAMIRIDMKALKEFCKDTRVQLLATGAFWYRCILNPHSKAANIPCLRSSYNFEHSRHLKKMFRVLKRAAMDKKGRCPWMISASFVTDGVQIKLLLETLKADHTPVPGFLELKNAGYRLGTKKHKLRDLLIRGQGVYNMDKVKAQVSDLEDVIVKGVDPGMVRIVEAVTDLGQNWIRSNANSLMSSTDGINGEDYRADTWAAKNEEAEAWRRQQNGVDTAYGAALLRTAATRRRTCVKQEFVEYCSVFQDVSNDLWAELLDIERRKQRFYRFQRVQSAVARIAEWLAPMRDKGKQKRVVMFGAASFMPKKGCAAAPRKRIVRELALRAVTIMVPEPYTSQTCPGCERKTEEGNGYRTRRCKTLAGRIACPLLHHYSDPHVEYDRDAAGSTNIGLRGVYRITNRETGGYKPRQ